MSTKLDRINLRISMPLKLVWMKAARDKGITLTELIEQAVRAFLG